MSNKTTNEAMQEIGSFFRVEGEVLVPVQLTVAQNFEAPYVTKAQLYKLLEDAQEQAYHAAEEITYDIAFKDGINHATAGFDKLLIRERLDERNQVALDNYDGHTFGPETDWRSKFDKFIRGNNARIASLQEQQTPEG